VYDVRLQADGDEPLCALPRGDQDFAAHAPALLRANLLILDVDARGAALDEHLGVLHRGREAAGACVCIRDDGNQVVHGCFLGPGLRRHPSALFELLAVVENMRSESWSTLVGTMS